MEVSRLRSFQMLQLEIVEVGDIIRFGSQSDHSVVERLVAEIEDLLVIRRR